MILGIDFPVNLDLITSRAIARSLIVTVLNPGGGIFAQEKVDVACYK